ncbi:NLR family CARD domain-containing protein 4-like [Branchiostoma floridae]|uniref:NLR family CARD domain-containing protein 4-like n=1 Tax=Branchiostoma floridae TaxID=7739 RepID=A0A9J7LVU9_BRAFL|nr:NLR family CARD domain-containing protein 4-like [Branchiostoma floridae]
MAEVQGAASYPGETAGVRKYFYYTKEKVSSDWKDLAFHLGFEQPDIDNIEGRNRDDKSRCMDLLEEWLKRNGERATIEVLMEALSESNLQSVVDGLRRKLQDMPSPVPVPVGAPGTDSSSEVLQTSMKKYYELKLSHFKPLIWNDNFTLALSDIFTQLEFIQKSEKQLKTTKKSKRSESDLKEERKKLKSLEDLFDPDVTGLSTAPRCILIEGEAGGGKTTFLSKEALDAVSQKTQLGRQHNTVLFIRLREVREGETIEEMVWDQCVPQRKDVTIESIETILEQNESRVLFLLDGYDELRPEARTAGQAIPKLLSGKLYPNSTIVITSRPSAGVQQHTRPDCHVHIMGFSPEHMVKYVRKYFFITESAELAEEFIRQHFTVYNYDSDNDDDEDDRLSSISDSSTETKSHDNVEDEEENEDEFSDESDSSTESHDNEEVKVESTASSLHVVLKDNKLFNNIIQTPLFLLLVCLLWEEDQEMVSTGTMTGLYDNLLTCLVRKYCKREGVDMPTEGLPTEVAESLLQFGKLALEALLRNETLLDLTEVEREKVYCELLLKLGVVSLEVSFSKLHPRNQLNFSHKTMQEFLAGRYVAHALVNQDIVELLQLTSITKALELSNLLQFTCGCDSRAAQAVMEELSKISKKEFSHLRLDNFQNKRHKVVPVEPEIKESVKTYRRFMLLGLDVLNERKEPGVLQAVSRALPVVIMDLRSLRKQHAALKYYLENIQSSHLPDRMILDSSYVDVSEALQYLEQLVTSPIPGLKVDLRLDDVTFDSPVPDETVQHLQQCLPGLRVDLKPTEQFDSPDETARLVSVLKDVPGLRVLDLAWTYLTPSSLKPLVQGFSHMSLLEELDLSRNPDLGDAGMEVLQFGLSSVPHLAILVLELVCMTAVGMSSLVPYMHHLVGLRELDISYNYIGDTGLESLTTVLPIFTDMQVLVLCNIDISPTGMRTLVPALCQLTRLIKLDISENAIGDPGLEFLAAILHRLTAMKVLVLRQTGISDRGISSLIKALPHLVQLQVLDVSFNNIGDSGIVSLVETLCQPSSLDMKQNPPGDKSLTTAPHYNTTLQELYIGGNRKVTGAGLERITQLISALPALTRLGMSGYWNTPAHLSDSAAMALAEALPRLPALERLDLEYISMEPAGFRAVVQAAEEHPTLEMLL